MAWRVTLNAGSRSFAFGTDRHWAMPPILKILRVFAFLHVNGGQDWHRCVWSLGTNQKTMFHLELHLREGFGFLDALLPLLFRMEEENQHFPQVTIIGTNSDLSSIPKYMHKHKIANKSSQLVYHMSGFVHFFLVVTQSTSTYYWNQPLRKGGNFIAHQILIVGSP